MAKRKSKATEERTIFCCESLKAVTRMDSYSGFPAGFVSQSMVDLKSKVGKAKMYERIAYRADRGKKGALYLTNWCPFCKARMNKEAYDKAFPNG